MGILKHFVLPTFGLVHAATIFACNDLKSWGAMVGHQQDHNNKDVTDKDEKSIRQNHMLGTLRGFNVAMLTLCGWGVFAKACHSDTRQAIAMAETALFAVVTVDALRLGSLNYFIPAAQALLALGGSIVSLLEPGIFTRDHSKSN